ncbi:hypothetical protein JTE90_012395 [Oedothorax gibbosus]|uniref:Uncharacterized protein n=1 Tax=Oedothorax gibbosus TaxID=931172 RepID=A0AAV6TVL9_9ARAC|nr:hypothetical protein JTE90_012395 [Oedothorax gibbosus]
MTPAERSVLGVTTNPDLAYLSPTLTWLDSLLRSPSDARQLAQTSASLIEPLPATSRSLGDLVSTAAGCSAVTVIPRSAPPLLTFRHRESFQMKNYRPTVCGRTCP